MRCGALADGQAAFTWLKNVIYKHGPELQVHIFSSSLILWLILLQVLYTLDGKMLEQEEIEVNVTGYKHSTYVFSLSSLPSPLLFSSPLSLPSLFHDSPLLSSTFPFSFPLNLFSTALYALAIEQRINDNSACTATSLKPPGYL